MEGRTMSVEIDKTSGMRLPDTQQEAAKNLKARSALLDEIRTAVKGSDLSQEDAAKRLGLTRPRTNHPLRGKLTKFSLDALVNIAAAAHLEIEIRVRDAA
jgi:predicted XRE-type DNA-binding protein